MRDTESGLAVMLSLSLNVSLNLFCMRALLAFPAPHPEDPPGESLQAQDKAMFKSPGWAPMAIPCMSFN